MTQTAAPTRQDALDPLLDPLTPSHEARRAILSAMLNHVGFDGWTGTALTRAVADAKLPQGAQDLYFRGGPLEVIEFWHEELDAQMAQQMAKLDLPNMRIRDKVTQAVLARLIAIGPHELAAKRAAHRLGLPDGLVLGPKLVWRGADAIWRAIGDTSTDYNYYTKRTTLSAVLSTCTLSWLADDSADKAKAHAFLDARIENVMQFEKNKFKLQAKLKGLPDLGETLGRIRFGSKGFKRRRARRR